MAASHSKSGTCQICGTIKIKVMKIYKLTWYLALEDQMKYSLITDKDVAEERYQDLRKALYIGCWLSLLELVENENHELVEGEGLHYCDI